jgi:alkylation response protein AidB-like acyl-CoA dehydrogenase
MFLNCRTRHRPEAGATGGNPMDLTLSPRQQAVQEKARALARKQKDLAAQEARKGRFPRKILEAWAKKGIFGTALPQEYGGAGGDYVSYVLAQAELAQISPAAALVLHVNHTLFGGTVAQFGTPEQKAKYLPPVAGGQAYASFALTEPEAGSDPGSLQTTARSVEGGWVLSGQKNFVTSGQIARYALVAALTAPDKGAKGISAFIVEMPDAGIILERVEEKMGLQGAVSVSLRFEEAFVPGENLLGEENQGLKVMLAALDAARVGSAAIAVGLGRAVLAEAAAYARQRRQFGQPLAGFQAIQFKLADMATDLEAAALLTLKAAWLKDCQLPYTQAAAMAKKFATDAAMAAAMEGVQIMGGYGYLKDYPMERFFRDAKAGQIYEGTNEIMRLIIARELLRS